MKFRIAHALVVVVLLVPALGCDDGSPTAPRSTAGNTQAATDSGPTVDSGPAIDSGPFMRALGGIADLSGQCPRISFVIGSIHIFTNATTLFQRADCSELREGSPVDASGTLQSDGRLFAREVADWTAALALAAALA